MDEKEKLQEEIKALTAQASCQYKPKGNKKCGNKHGQIVNDKIVYLYEARLGLKMFGYICSHCKKRLNRKHSLIPIQIIAQKIIENSIAEPEPSTK